MDNVRAFLAFDLGYKMQFEEYLFSLSLGMLIPSSIIES